MEIRVFCNNLINLNSFKNLKLIRLGVLSYNLNKATLTGDVKVSGEYIKEDDTEMGFEEIVPFTVVFRNEKVKIEKVYTDNDTYNTNDIQGVDVSFDLVVNYSLIEMDEMNEEIEKKENECLEKEEIIEVPVEIVDEVQMVDNKSIDKMLEEAENITKEYDELLSEVLNVRNNEIENNTESNVNVAQDSKKVTFNNQKTTYNKITIYYLNKENEIESISKERRISINDIYKKNNDFEKTRRIIINE